MMKRFRRWVLTGLSVLALAGVWSFESVVHAEVLAAVTPSSIESGYAAGGADACLECHDETGEFPVLSILKTPHAARADARTPLASAHACQTCHGASAAHVEDSDDVPEIAFGPDAPAAPQNAVCLNCHQRGVAMHWVGGVHEREGLACASCHTIHVGEDAGGDPILSKNVERGRAPNSQAETCFRCHKQQRAMAYRISSHPIRYGQMNCSDCHSPHGSVGEMQLVRPTLNETCYTCHAEKRGPFLWEHAPAREDCSNCHAVHGSNHQALLKTRGPWLCQQCHAASRHPSTAYDAGDLFPLNGGTNSSKLQAKHCLNCHPEVHGSNHPSGVRWTR